MTLLNGKRIVVTGGARGLGRAYALSCAQEGGSVMVNDLDQVAVDAVVEEIRAAGGTAAGHAGSVAAWADAGALIDGCVEAFGGIDGLVNNAGITAVGEPWEFGEEDLRRVVDVNLLGTLNCGTHALRAMVAQGSGTILNVTSGALLGIREHSLYGATKGAVMSLTYGWALDAAPHGVRVNALSPLARTKMSEAWANRDAAHMDEPPPEAVAPVVAYLLSDRAAAISGQVIRLDAGGLSLMTPPAFPASVPVEPRTVDEVARVFGEQLRAALEPVGFGRADLSGS
ncbi:MAG: SDR family NAD(P)-dependent oxidoreductase [Solirubrobacteraceae bacterium]